MPSLSRSSAVADPTVLLLLSLGFAGLAASVPTQCQGRDEGGADEPYVPPADHHVHVWSPAARDVGMRIQKALGEEVVAEEDMRVLSGDDVVAAHPDRLVAFFSVNPLADYALDEIERLADDEAFAGLKLHLGNSDVDLRDAEDVGRLRDVFARVSDLGLAVVVHLGGRSDSFGAPDAEAFVDEVLPAAPDVPVQVAHMGGPGGFGPGSRASPGPPAHRRRVPRPGRRSDALPALRPAVWSTRAKSGASHSTGSRVPSTAR